MGDVIHDVCITPQRIIPTNGGSVMRVLKKSSKDFCGFGEAYFSLVAPGVIRGWKRHHRMTLNLIVPIGGIKFVLIDDRLDQATVTQVVEISDQNYCRLTVPPKIWVAFQGCGERESVLLNIANIEHDPDESDQIDIGDFKFHWADIQ